MMRFYWQSDPVGVTHYTALDDLRGEYKPDGPDLYAWQITWEGLTLAHGYVSSIQEAMGSVANWYSARQGSIIGEALTVLMAEVKRLREVTAAFDVTHGRDDREKQIDG